MNFLDGNRHVNAQLAPIADRIRADVRLSSIDEAMAANREGLCDEQLVPCLSGIIVSVPPAAGDEENDWDFVDMLEVYLLHVKNVVVYYITSKSWSDVQVSWPRTGN